MQGPIAGADAGPLCADRLHLADCRFDDSAERATPAAMRGADHPGKRIVEQDRRTIGGENAEGDTRDAGDDAIGLAAPRRATKAPPP